MDAENNGRYVHMFKFPTGMYGKDRSGTGFRKQLSGFTPCGHLSPPLGREHAVLLLIIFSPLMIMITLGGKKKRNRHTHVLSHREGNPSLLILGKKSCLVGCLNRLRISVDTCNAGVFLVD